MSRWLQLRQIAFVARERDPVVDDLKAVLGLEVCYEDPGVAKFGLHNALLPVGSQFLEVVAPVQNGTTAERYLDRRDGDGGYMVITQCNDHADRRARVDKLGIRVVAQLDHGGFTNMQLHPADTGGSFLEIDQQADDDPTGPWEPAGQDWQPTVRTDVVSAITAAELQCDDPAKVAQQWSEIVQIDVEPDGDRWSIPLTNATLRFVPITDGRGEGLGGLDIAVVDGDRLRTAAGERDRLVSADQVLLGGVRFTLCEQN